METEQIAEMPDLVSLVEMPEWKSILLDLVKSEKMDPWDIDLVHLAQKYLERIKSMQSNNLYVPANALLACAILLNMKADALRQFYVEEEEDAPADEYVEDFALFFDEPEPVVDDAPADESPQSPPEVLPPARITARRVTLEELLAAMERVMKAKKTIRRKPELNINPIDMFIDEMERDDVDLIIQETYERIKSSLDSEGITTLSRVVPSRDALSIVKTFLPVLYLANDGKINVWQEKPFDEVFISVIENDGSSGSKEAH